MDMSQEIPTNLEPEMEPTPPADLTELTNQLLLVAKTRKNKAAFDEEVRELRDAWENANREKLDAATELRECLIIAEEYLRALTITAYQATGNKQPVPGVGIRENKRYTYDPKEALAWATSHKIALALDKKAFEAIAKTSDIEFVEISTEIQATIAKDLEAITLE